MSVNSTNPNALFGGTWSLWGAGRVPVCVNTSDSNFNTVEKTGGEKTHKLTVNEMPSHKHNPDTNAGLYALRAGGGSQEFGPGGSYSTEIKILNTGGDQPHNNLQPYITCYMWKRTA